MATRYLYLARHGAADPFGDLTPAGHDQARLLGRRLAHLPIDAVWHSPLPRAEASARIVAEQLAGPVPAQAAEELVDHVPYVPPVEEMPPAWAPFFDGYDPAEATAGHRTAQRLTARFARAPEGVDVHEVLITHAYPIAWLVRDAFDALPERWLGLAFANAGLTVIEYRPALPPSLTVLNELSHLPPELRWTGFPHAPRP